MTSPLFQSFARNGEDVVLWRALGGLAHGTIVEAPSAVDEYSAGRALAERGWNHIIRSRSDFDSGAGADWPQEVQALVVPEVGFAASALRSLAEAGTEPWVVVVSAADLPVAEAQAELTKLEQDLAYELCLFDGVNGYFAHPDRAEELRPTLSYPASSRDGFQTPAERSLTAANAQLTRELREASETVIRWRTAALQRWDAASGGGQVVHVYGELEAMRNTVSWRVTRPLRAVRRRIATLPGWGG